MNAAGPEIGDKIRFRPAAWMESPEHYSSRPVGREVTGPGVQINTKNRWFRVAYDRGGQTGFECFKF